MKTRILLLAALLAAGVSACASPVETPRSASRPAAADEAPLPDSTTAESRGGYMMGNGN